MCDMVRKIVRGSFMNWDVACVKLAYATNIRDARNNKHWIAVDTMNFNGELVGEWNSDKKIGWVDIPASMLANEPHDLAKWLKEIR